MSTMLTHFNIFINGLDCMALLNFFTPNIFYIYILRNTSELFH